MINTRDLRPMLAVGGDPEPPLQGADLLYEPKYDGIRAIVELVCGPSGQARFWSRNGNEKSEQFPDIVAALEDWGRNLSGTLVLDGEVVALDNSGTPQGFQRLQHRSEISLVLRLKALRGPLVPGARRPFTPELRAQRKLKTQHPIA